MRLHLGLTLSFVLTCACGVDAQDKDSLPDGAIVRLGVHRLRVPGGIRETALTPDGRRLVVAFNQAADKPNVTIFDTATGLPRKTLAIVNAIRLSMAKERPLLAVNTDKGFELWDVSKEERIRQWGPPQGYGVSAMAISPDGTRLVTAAATWVGQKNENVFVIWDLGTGQQLQLWRPAGNPIASLRFADDDAKFFTVSTSYSTSDGKKTNVHPGALMVWETKTGKMLLERRNDAGALAIAPDGSRFARAADKAIELVDLQEPYKTVQLPIFGSSFAFTPDGKHLIVHPNSGETLRLWDLANKKEVRTLEGAVYGYQLVPQFSVDGRLLAMVQSDAPDYFRYSARGGSVRLWDVTTGKKIRYDTGHPGTVNGLAYSPDGKRLATFSDDILLLYDPATGAELRRWVAHQGSILQIAFAPDGKRLASCSADGTIAIWDPASGKECLRLALVAKAPVRAIAFTPDGANLISIDDQATVTWDIDRGAAVRSLTAPTGMVAPVLAATGQYAACVGHGRRFGDVGASIKWLNVRPGKTVKSFDPAPNRVSDDVQRRFEYTIPWELAFSPDGKMFATCDSLQTQGLRAQIVDHTVRVWESATRREILRIGGMPAYTHVLAFSPDNRILAHGIGPGNPWGHGAGNDTLILRDISAAKQEPVPDPSDQSKPLRERFHDFRKISGHLGSITSLVFSPDGQFLATGGSDAVVYIWPVKDFYTRPDVAIEKDSADAYWPRLADPDGGKAYRAIAQLERRPNEALALLKKYLRPVPTADEKAIAKNLRDLSSTNFAIRQQAFVALEKAGEQAAHLVEAATKSPPNIEVKRRLELLLEKLDDPLAEVNQLRAYRCLVLLERINTPAAHRLLRELTEGAPSAWLTVEARQSLARMAR